MYEKKTLVDETMLKIYTDELIRSLKDMFPKRIDVNLTNTSDINTVIPERAGILAVDNKTGNVYLSTGNTTNDWVNLTDINSATETDVDNIMKDI